MDNIIIASFLDRGNAIKGLHRLNELDREGDISVYDKILIRKTVAGEIEILENENNDGWRTLAGLAIGGLIGTLGGPVGIAVGLYTGTVIGAVVDFTHYSFDQDFIDNMSKSTPNGTTSIIAEVDESSSAFIDEALQPLGGVVWRSDVYEQHDRYVNNQMDKLDTEIQVAENELSVAADAQKARITAKVTELRNDRKAKVAEFEASAKERLSELKSKMESNRAKLQEQFTKLENRVLDEVSSLRLERIKKKLADYELKIDDLNGKMTNLKHAHAV